MASASAASRDLRCCAGCLRGDWLRIDGKLTFDRTVSTQLLFETIVNTRGSEVECGTPTQPIPASVTHKICFSNRSYAIDSRQPTDLDLGRDPRLLGRGWLSHGSRVMWGAAKTSWLRTAAGSAPMAGDTSLTLAPAPSGWEIGDTIDIGGTGFNGSEADLESEERTIAAINGAVVSWGTPLVYDHDHRNGNVSRTDLQPGIANLTRNIVIRSEDPKDPAWRRGHTMDMHMMCRADIWDVQHISLGRTVRSPKDPLGTIDGNFGFKFIDRTLGVTTEPLTARSNIKSRYPMHAHFVGFNRAAEDVYSNCTVQDTPGCPSRVVL